MSRAGKCSPAPPRAAERLLEAALPRGQVGSSIIGDLHQEYQERGAQSGRLRLIAWYWLQALALAWHYSRRVSPHGIPLNDKGHEPMTSLISDLRYGVRMLVKTPLVSVIATLTIAMGIALTVHTFSIVYGSVMRGLPLPDDDRLMQILQNDTEAGFQGMSLGIHDYLDFRDQSDSFEELGTYYWGTVNLAGDDQPPERYEGAFVSANALSLLGVPALLGRTFVAGEDSSDAEPSIVIGYAVWRNRFGGDPNIVGRTLRINGETGTVLGVMPEGFRFPFNHEVWIPHRAEVDGAADRGGGRFETFGRLRTDVSVEAATAEISAITERIRSEFPEEMAGIESYISLFEHRYMPPQITAAVWVQLVAVFGVLMIACANVANLLLARASVRGREVAIRSALGASRARVIRQLLIEALVLGIVGGTIGLIAAKIGVDRFSAALVDIQKPYWIDIRVDAPVVFFSIAVTLLAVALAGTLPALRASGCGVSTILQDESRGTSLRMGRLSGVLVIGEIAISVALLITAGLMIKSIINVNRVDLGFRTDNILTARVGLFEVDYPARTDRESFFISLLDRLRSQPGIDKAALTSHVPGRGSMRLLTSIEGEDYASTSDYPVVAATIVSSGFFDAYDVPILQGRDFRPEEARSDSDAVVIVNESFVRRFLPDDNPLGQLVKAGRVDSDDPWMRVVGVAADMHIGGGVGGLGSDRNNPEQYYVPFGAFDTRFSSIVLRTPGTPQEATSVMRSTVTDLDSNMPIYEVATMERAMEQATWAFRVFGQLFATLGVAALFLASVGLYGVMSFSVSLRRTELGIRMALGAQARDLLGTVMRKGAWQLAIGIVLGLGIGVILSRPLSAITFGVETTDLSVYAAIVATITVTGLLATLLPARKATQVDPNDALRIE